MPTRELASTVPSLNIDGLAPGAYHVSVGAADRWGVVAMSSSFDMRVLGVEVPEGARRVQDALEIGPHQRIHLSDPKGLELSYGTASHFVPAPNEVGLARGQATLVRLREAGHQDELAFKLVPRDVHADIAIGPSMARWPRDTVKIRIALRHGDGRLVTSASPKVTTEVHVNTEVVPVKWVRNGNVLECDLAPPSDKGPWAVRVRVQDEIGEEIGWSFLEVARL
jgi:hypothetical protein